MFIPTLFACDAQSHTGNLHRSVPVVRRQRLRASHRFSLIPQAARATVLTCTVLTCKLRFMPRLGPNSEVDTRFPRYRVVRSKGLWSTEQKGNLRGALPSFIFFISTKKEQQSTQIQIHSRTGIDQQQQDTPHGTSCSARKRTARRSGKLVKRIVAVASLCLDGLDVVAHFLPGKVGGAPLAVPEGHAGVPVVDHRLSLTELAVPAREWHGAGVSYKSEGARTGRGSAKV